VKRPRIIAIAGRRVDAANATEPRFPAAHAARVGAALRRFMQEQQATGLASSAACGADLLAQEAAAALGLERRVVLPFERTEFRRKSVTDRPGDWGARYDRILAGLPASQVLVLPAQPGDDDAAYARTNAAILDAAEEMAGADGDVVAVMVWNGAPRGEGDLTVQFARTARARSLEVHEILTL
jgi:hypothetical protein